MQDVKMEYAKLKNDGETFSKLRTENSRGLENAGLKNNVQQFQQTSHEITGFEK